MNHSNTEDAHITVLLKDESYPTKYEQQQPPHIKVAKARKVDVKANREALIKDLTTTYGPRIENLLADHMPDADDEEVVKLAKDVVAILWAEIDLETARRYALEENRFKTKYAKFDSIGEGRLNDH